MSELRATYTDSDNDGATIKSDCDDLNWYAFPGALEICATTVDEDCDGDVDEADCVVDPEYALDESLEPDPMTSSRNEDFCREFCADGRVMECEQLAVVTGGDEKWECRVTNCK